MAQICHAVFLQLRHILTVGKNLLNSNISSTCSHNMVNFGPLAAEISSRVWGTLARFQRLSGLRFVTAPTSLNGNRPNFTRCLAISWGGTLYIHFRELLSHNRILPGAKFTLCPFHSRMLAALLHSTGVVDVRQTAMFTRGRHLYLVWWPSRWASTHILVVIVIIIRPHCSTPYVYVAYCYQCRVV